MNIGILGAGNMGGTLGKVWAQHGNEVSFGTRSPEKALELSKSVNMRAGSYEDAAKFGDVIFIGTPWSATESLLKSLSKHLSGKIVIDCTNALAADFLSLSIPPTTSAGELIQEWLPDSKVVKAYNTIGAKVLLNPNYNGTIATGFYCGNDIDAKKVVAELIAQSGFEPVDCGDLKQARNLEAMTLLFLNLAFKQGMGGQIAFNLLKR
ncbi:MAG: NADPH-dependent F420 reductase [Chloroherpetonaceae bacterium]